MAEVREPWMKDSLVAARYIDLEKPLNIIYIEDQPDQELHRALFHTLKKWVPLHLQEKERT